jgi:hypothetical protein
MSDEKKEPEAPKPEPDPAAAAKQAAGLLWQAARGVATEIKREVEKAGLKDHIKAAKTEIDTAIRAAAKELDEYIAKVQPPPPGYTKDWPPSGAPQSSALADDAAGAPAAQDGDKPKEKDGDMPKEGAPKDERADAGVAPGGGKDATGERRDMRILLDDDEPPKK